MSASVMNARSFLSSAAVLHSALMASPFFDRPPRPTVRIAAHDPFGISGQQEWLLSREILFSGARCRRSDKGHAAI